MVLQKLKAKFIDKFEFTVGRFKENIKMYGPKQFFIQCGPKKSKLSKV